MRFFLECPDEVERPHPTESESRRRRRVDVLDDAYHFELSFGRKPTSWRDYSYGIAHLGRAEARAALRAGGAAMVAMSDKDGRDTWLQEVSRAAQQD